MHGVPVSPRGRRGQTQASAQARERPDSKLPLSSPCGGPGWHRWSTTSQGSPARVHFTPGVRGQASLTASLSSGCPPSAAPPETPDPKSSPEAQVTRRGRGPLPSGSPGGSKFPEAQGGGQVVPSPPRPGDGHLSPSPCHGVPLPACLGVPQRERQGAETPGACMGAGGPKRGRACAIVQGGRGFCVSEAGADPGPLASPLPAPNALQEGGGGGHWLPDASPPHP